METHTLLLGALVYFVNSPEPWREMKPAMARVEVPTPRDS
jgi:hypothetical protein